MPGFPKMMKDVETNHFDWEKKMALQSCRCAAARTRTKDTNIVRQKRTLDPQNKKLKLNTSLF